MKKKCLRIILTAQFPDDYLNGTLQKHAQKLGVEGTAQIIDQEKKIVRITVCGEGDALDQFIDIFHEGIRGFILADIEIEPFLKDKDYRDVFRIIE